MEEEEEIDTIREEVMGMYNSHNSVSKIINVRIEIILYSINHHKKILLGLI